MTTVAEGTRTIIGRHPRTKEPIPVTLAESETLVGYGDDGMPRVCRADGRPGGTFGVTYLCRDMPYDDREAFDPLGIGVF